MGNFNCKFKNFNKKNNSKSNLKAEFDFKLKLTYNFDGKINF